MSWSLKLTHGDFDVSNASLGTVTGQAKLVQDFRCYILERMGTDDLHPEFGSLIDGGTKPDGTEAESVIGTTDFRQAFLVIENEIRRIAKDYQEKQLARARSDKFNYNKTTFSAGEILLGIASIDAVQNADTMNINVVLKSANNADAVLSIPIPNTLIVT